MGDRVAVVVVTYNSAHVIDGLLDSLPAALDGVAARVVVVDNSSTDETCEVVRRRDDCLLVRQPNLGYSAGINRGVQELGGDEPILVLNPDLRLYPGAVPRLLEALRLPGTGIVAPRVYNEDGTLVLSLRREPTLSRALGFGDTGRAGLSEYVTDPATYEVAQTCDWALGAVLLVDRECHEALSGWDESFFLYSEETDLCLRARDRGWVTRYVPTAEAMHMGAQSGQSPRIHSMQILNRVRLFSRRHGRVSSFGYYLLSLASELSWIVRGHGQSIAAVRALLWPRSRPPELGCSDTFVPR